MSERPELAGELSNDPQPPSSAAEHGRQRPIVTAARYERADIARLLLESGADVNAGVPLWSPQGHALFEACARGHVEMVELFLAAGATPNVEVESSGNCFSITSKKDRAVRQQIHALLIAAGAEPPEEE